jgi:predicted nucleotidyltransferase
MDLHVQLITASAAIFAPEPVLFAYLYGSYARGDVHPFSDIDIAVYTELEDLDAIYRLEMNLGLALDAHLDHKASTDVRTLNHLPVAVVGEVVTHGRLIYSRDEAARVDFEVYARKRYFDFKPAIQLYNRYALNRMRSRDDGV